MTDFFYQDILQQAQHGGADETPYKKLAGDGDRDSADYISTLEVDGQTFLKVEPDALRILANEAIHDMSFFLRPGHLQQLRNILDDKDASANDHFVALELLKNANIAAGGILPGCQDTGTAIVKGKKGERVLTGEDDRVALSQGIYETYQSANLRYSQLSPTSIFEEKNTGNNLPAEIKIEAVPGDEYHFLFLTKGGGSANKSFLYQETKALLNEESLMNFLDTNLRTIGTSACPPYHLALVIGGTSAEFCVDTAKLASTRYLDNLPTSGGEHGQGFRDLEWEEKILEMTRELGIGAQFGGKYFCHDVRVIRLPRHGASCPVALAVSCSADRQVKAKITRDGVFMEQLETDPAKYLPETAEGDLSEDVVEIDLNLPMDEVSAELSKHPVKTRLSLTGTLVVARDTAHALIKKRLDEGEAMPDYLLKYPIYYAGPAKTPEGMASGSFGPTTAGRMDVYVDEFQSKGASLVMLAKGNRSTEVKEACAKYGGFYLGSIGGPAARLTQHSIKEMEVLEYEELGMEAVFKISVEDFPAFIIIDDKGNDFYTDVSSPVRIKK